MAKAKQEVPETQEVEVLTPPKVYDQRAYSILEKDGKFHLICVSYNADLEVGSATILESNSDTFEIQYSLEEACQGLLE